jgi:very-short-patch-repair endonuclease
VPRRRIPSRLTGPATRALAREAGISQKQLRQRDVARLSRDTYLPRSMARDVRARIAAVLLTAPGEAVVSHLTAADLWGIAVPRQGSDQRVHITVATGSAVRGRVDRSIHRSPFEAEEIVRRDGLPVTAPARTWRDLAAVLHSGPLLAVTDQLLARWCTRQELEEQLARRPRGRGCARARAVLPIADARAESPMESMLRWLVHEAELPTPSVQYVIRDDAGLFLGRADLAWPAQKVLVEFDGDLHRERDVFVRDLRRQNALIAAGWTILRFSSADLLGRPEEVISQIRLALAM